MYNAYLNHTQSDQNQVLFINSSFIKQNTYSFSYMNKVYYSGRLFQCHSANSPRFRSYTATDTIPFLPIIIWRPIPVTRKTVVHCMFSSYHIPIFAPFSRFAILSCFRFRDMTLFDCQSDINTQSNKILNNAHIFQRTQPLKNVPDLGS